MHVLKQVELSLNLQQNITRLIKIYRLFKYTCNKLHDSSARKFFKSLTKFCLERQTETFKCFNKSFGTTVFNIL